MGLRNESDLIAMFFSAAIHSGTLCTYNQIFKAAIGALPTCVLSNCLFYLFFFRFFLSIHLSFWKLSFVLPPRDWSRLHLAPLILSSRSSCSRSFEAAASNSSRRPRGGPLQPPPSALSSCVIRPLCCCDNEFQGSCDGLNVLNLVWFSWMRMLSSP